MQLPKRDMHLKEARDNNKMEQFAREHEKTHPVASKHHFHGVIKAMASQTEKPKQGTSRKGSAGVEPILKFFGVFMKMLFGNVNVGGADASLQVFPKVFMPLTCEFPTTYSFAA